MDRKKKKAAGDLNSSEVQSLVELMEEGARVRRERARRLDYGPWKYDAKKLTLTHVGERYEIDLEECKTSAAVLDWIFQIRTKGWADAETMMGFVDVIRDKLRPQATLCSHGQEKGPIDVKKVIKASGVL
jgi:hypothetical protein